MTENHLHRLVPATPPFARALAAGGGGMCTNCGEFHEFHSITEHAIAEIMALGGLPFACDAPEAKRVYTADTIEELKSHYTAYLMRRLGIPSWFVVCMTLEAMVEAWALAIQYLVHPRTGDMLGLIDEGRVMDSPLCLFWQDAEVGPEEVWGTGPVTLQHYRPLQLFWRFPDDHPETPGFLYRIEVGYVGGVTGGYTQDDPPVMPGRDRRLGREIKALLPDPVPLLTRQVIVDLEVAGREWELAHAPKEVKKS